MGATANYDIPYPDSEGLVKDGATAMQSIAENTDTALVEVDSPPMLILVGSDTPSGADNRIGWDTAAPATVVGSGWGFPGSGALIIPPKPGLYLVNLTFKLDPDGGASGGTYTYTVRIQTKVQDADQATAITSTATTQVVDGEDGPRINQTGLVRIPDDAASRGVQVQITVPEVIGSNAAPDTGGRLQIIYLGRP